MNSIFWACLALAACPSVFAIYFTGHMEIFRPPADRTLRNNSYFGYSITYDAFRKKLVISSPRENDIGTVYTCDIPTQKCETIPVNINRVSPKYPHDYWFGATVKSGPDFTMMCAPRYTDHTLRKSTDTGFDAYITQGRCYTLMKNGNIFNNRILKESAVHEDSPSPMEATMDSFGWSIDVASNDQVVVGGPGMFTGRAMFYRGYQNVPDLIRHKKKTFNKFNFGYAVATGAFINQALSIAVGSTYGRDGVGEVHFFKGMAYQQLLDKGIDTDEVGSMFGAVICAAKLIVTKRKTDLLVGAPTFAKKDTYNLGAVYVYLAIINGKSPVFKRRMVGKVPGAMFGSAIVNLKDLNNDGRDDIAIAAPLEEDGRGAVYLYSGADLISELTDQTLKPLQKIEPEGKIANIKSFGMSLTPLLDYDQNGCNELAIGAPYDDTVVLLRCMASITLKEMTIDFPNLQNRTRDKITNFQFEVCLSFEIPTLPETITAIITTTVEIDHEDVKINGTTPYTFNTSLRHEQTRYCHKIPLFIPLDGNYETGISCTASSKLTVDPRTLPDFDSSRVVLSDRSVLNAQNTLWAAECAGKICVPNLKLTYFISFDKPKDDPYVIGSSKDGIETITLSVDNTGEVAYEPCVRVHFVGVNVLVPGGCVYEASTEEHILKCEPQKPIQTNEHWTTGEIQVEMSHLTNKDKMINITLVLYDHCSNNVKMRITEKLIPLKADPQGITAKGYTDIGDFVNMTELDIKENGKKIIHEYKIVNSGPTDWVDLQVEVTLIPQPYIQYNEDAVEVGLSSTTQNKPCNLIPERNTTDSVTYLCMVDSLFVKNQRATIYIPMFVLPKTLDGVLIEDNNVTIRSFIKVLPDDDYSVSERIITTISSQETPFPTETVIIAVVVGLCILIIIALILYRVGFLRRKRREELEKIKEKC